jgi:hypothetical protein
MPDFPPEDTNMNEYKDTRRRLPGRIGLVLAVLVLAGCSGMKSISMPSLSLTAAPLELDLAAQPTAGQGVKGKRPVTVSIANYVDARATPNSEKIGDITAAVNDMLGTELRLRDVAGTVTTAMENQLRASGYQVVAGSGQAAVADFVLSGAIREFSLDIGGRDYVAIAVETTLRDARGGIVWSGLVSERADRFAGVTGNSRASIARYLGAALAKVTGKTRDAIDESVMRALPELFDQAAPVRPATPGVTVLAARPEPAQSRPAVQSIGASGRLTLATTPSRAKVYLADVYYGLTPLALDLEPGIHTLTLKLDGYPSATEKVSVRKGETTELETRFAK